MKRVFAVMSVIPFALVHAQGMAPVEQYRMDRAAEIALAKSAAPAGISDDADVLVGTRRPAAPFGRGGRARGRDLPGPVSYL